MTARAKNGLKMGQKCEKAVVSACRVGLAPP